MGLVDDVISLLQTQWNDAVITTANTDFINGSLNTASKTVPKIVVQEMANALQLASLNMVANIKRTQFEVKCYADAKNDVDKLVSECRRIIDAKSLSGGWWHVNSVYFLQGEGHTIAIMNCEQQLFVTSSGWTYT